MLALKTIGRVNVGDFGLLLEMASRSFSSSSGIAVCVSVAGTAYGET